MYRKVDRFTALTYLINNGISHIPLRQSTKYPAVSNFQHTAKFHEIKKDDNIGVVLGCTNTLSRKCLMCVDFDSQEAYENHKNIPDTLSIKTSKGYHFYYFTDNDYNTKIKINSLPIDILSSGHYAVFASSFVVNSDGEEFEYLWNGKKVTHLDSKGVQELEKALNYTFEIKTRKAPLYKKLLRESGTSGYKCRSSKEHAICCSMIKHGVSMEYGITEFKNSVYYSVSKTFERGNSYLVNCWRNAEVEIYDSNPKKRIAVRRKLDSVLLNLNKPKMRTILSVIYNYAASYGIVKDNLLHFSVSHGQIADYSGSSRTTVTKYMSYFLRNKYLTITKTCTYTESTNYSIPCNLVADDYKNISQSEIEVFKNKENAVSIPDAFRSTKSNSFIHLYSILDTPKTNSQLSSILNFNSNTTRAILYKFVELGLLIKKGRYFILNATKEQIAKRLCITGKNILSYVEYKTNTYLRRIKSKFKVNYSYLVYLVTRNVVRCTDMNELDYFHWRIIKTFYDEALLLRS